MAVAALAEAGAALGSTAGWARLRSWADFLLATCAGPSDGRWLRSWQAVRRPGRPGAGPGSARHLAYAADHAWLVEAFARLAEATGRARWIAAATDAADALLDLFWTTSRVRST